MVTEGGIGYEGEWRCSNSARIHLGAKNVPIHLAWVVG